MNSKSSIAELWAYFELPPDDLKAIQKEYGWQLGNHFGRIAANEKTMVERILHPAEVQTWRDRSTYDLRSPYAIKLALLSIYASFIAQNYQRYNPQFKIKLLPEDVSKYFRYPYSETRDYNIESLKAWRATLPPAYQREVCLNV